MVSVYIEWITYLPACLPAYLRNDGLIPPMRKLPPLLTKKIKPSYLPRLRHHHHPSILIYIPSSRICADPKEKKEENLTSPVCNP